MPQAAVSEQWISVIYGVSVETGAGVTVGRAVTDLEAGAEGV